MDMQGKSNIITIGAISIACLEPPMLGFAVRKSRYSYSALKATGEFVVNIPSQNQLWATDYCGNHSGRDVDKFKEAKLTPVPADKVQPPLIGECPINVECVVRHSLALGSHDFFIGEVVAVHINDQCLSSQGRWDVDRINPIAYCFGDYWSLKEGVGRSGLSKGA
jgi:flavin reductase (DIM6/NTAB) family NADH-FMN oxidoreductase RutF